MISTTSLLIEHLLSGFMALVWMGLVIHYAYPSTLEVALPIIGVNLVALLGIAVFGYPIGMIIDNLADTILSPIRNKFKNSENYLSVTELLHHLDNDNILGWFECNRFKIRIMRASFLNSLLTMLVLIGSSLFRCPDYVGPLMLFFTMLCVLSFVTWREEVKATYRAVEKWRGYIGR